MFSNYSTDEREFDAAREAWKALCERCLRRLSVRSDWQDEGDGSYLDGTPMRDGNPMCTYVDKRNGKALRIVQDRGWPRPQSRHLIAYMDTRLSEELNAKEIPELVISGILSEKNMALSTVLIEAWANPGTTKEDMDRVIRISLPYPPPSKP